MPSIYTEMYNMYMNIKDNHSFLATCYTLEIDWLQIISDYVTPGYP